MSYEKAGLFAVRSVAIIGASEEPGKIGSGLYRSISSTFKGPIYCVNPGYETMWGQPSYPTVLEIPAEPSHAVIAVARRFVPKCLEQCAEKGIHYVVVISAGFKETDEIGAQMEREMQTFCEEHDIVLLGPNCLGFIDTSLPYNGTFLLDQWKKGPVAVISQSGGVGMALLSALDDQRCGISKWAGVGNEAVIDAVDMLRIFADDPETKAIGVCFEGLRDFPGFLKLARKVNRHKPIVVLRDGKGQTGMRAAASHTGTMAQSDAVMVDLIRQAGLIEARSCRECAAMLKALSMSHAPAGDRAVMLTNTAGPSILASDELEAHGIRIPMPSTELQEKTDLAIGLRLGLKNPADISSGGLNPRNYGAAAETMLGSDEYDILLSFFTLGNHLIIPAEQMVAAKEKTGKPVVACLLGKQRDFFAYDLLPESASVPCYCDTSDAAAAVRALIGWGKARRKKQGMAVSRLDTYQKKNISDYLKECPGGILPESDAKKLLTLAGIPVDVPVRVSSIDEAAEAAERIGYPVVLKVDSHRISHKTDVGGVRLNLGTPEALRTAYAEMLPKMQQIDPDAGLTVQTMMPEGFEMILGGVRTPGTGPLVMAGMGGIYSEVLKDTRFEAVPLTEGEAEEMISSLRCAPILNGYRGDRKDAEGIRRILETLSELMEEYPEIGEIDLNPCRVYENRTGVLDARIVIN